MKRVRLPDPVPAAKPAPSTPSSDECHSVVLRVMATAAVVLGGAVTFWASPHGHGPFDALLAPLVTPVSRAVALLALVLVGWMWFWGPRPTAKSLGASLTVLVVGVSSTLVIFGVLFPRQPLLALAAFFLVAAPLNAWTSRKLCGRRDTSPR